MSLTTRLLETVQRGVLLAYRAVAGTLPRAQYRSAGVDSDPDIELLEPAGFASAPAAGANVLVLNVGSDGDHAVAFAQDPTNRPTLAAGETAIHALSAGGKAIVVGASSIKLGVGATKAVGRVGDTVSVTIPAGAVCVNVVSGAAVMNAAPITLSGTITSGSSVVKAVD